jgi:chromosomal replication initiation ATPase DnaA
MYENGSNGFDKVPPLVPQHCQTADEVRALARKVQAKKFEMWRKKKFEAANQITSNPQPPQPEISRPSRIEQDFAEAEREIIELLGTGRRIRSKEIIAAASEYFNVPAAYIMSQARVKHVSYARQVTMYLCRELTPLSMVQIGRRLDGRDHTTVLHGWRKIDALLRENEDTRMDVAAIKKRIGLVE